MGRFLPIVQQSTIMSRRTRGGNAFRLWLAWSMILVVMQSWSAPSVADAVAPTIDYSHNMRILKLPKSTPVGELIYRLKGSDGDPNSRLTFGATGIESRQLLEVLPVAKSWNEADVYLRSPLEEPLYNLTIFVSDGTNKTTQVESTILVTQFDNTDHDHHLEQAHQSNDSLSGASYNEQFLLSPFVEPTKNVFNVPENTNPGETIGVISVLESRTSDLPVRFELRGSGSEKFAIKYVFGPQGHSRGELVLAQPVDFEKQNLFSLKVLALNAWSNIKYDTRNVATLDIVIAVADVQDSPPQFKQLPSAIRIVNTMQPGDLVWRFAAEDGDYADPRPIQFALDVGSPLVSYFDIDKSKGELRMLRSARDLALNANWHLPTWSTLTILASELPDTSHGFDHLWPPMFTRTELPLVMVEQFNEPPEFLGGWQTNESLRLGQRTLHGFLMEPTFGGETGDDLQQQQPPTLTNSLVQWYTNSSSTVPMGSQLQSDYANELSKSTSGRPCVVDLGLGTNGTFELRLEGPDAHLFQVEPAYPVSRQTTFNLFVRFNANRSLFDLDNSADQLNGVESSGGRPPNGLFQVDLVATDFGSPQRLSSKIKLSIELLDANDNAPQFEQDLYTFSVYENAQLGQIIGTIRARDLDRKSPRVRYTALTGYGGQLFHLDQTSGSLTLESQLDREKESHYLLVAEAQDQSGASNYTKIMVNILDVNDNAPIFSQQHYDAILQVDGTFQQPLVISAQDDDEPNSANSQIAYEIIAGNQNDQFAIDSLSGVIYPNNQQQTRPIQIPSILNEPIVPFDAMPPRSRPDQAGKILPPIGGGSSGSPFVGHEVEETTSRSSDRQQFNRPLRKPLVGKQTDEQRSGRLLMAHDHQADYQSPALDLLLQTESASSQQNTLQPLQTSGGQSQLSRKLNPMPGNQIGFDPFKLAPLTTLVVRAHDFGIPLRSSTCKVNIYNQALQTRSISLILNGTLEQLEPRRELIERSFGALTGSRATIESLETLSDSSSICIAKIKLAIPQSSLVDLTDLGALMSAIGYKQHQAQQASKDSQLQQQQQQEQQFRQPLTTVTHYIATGDRIYPAGSLPHLSASSNLSSTSAAGGGGGNQATPTFYTDINSFALDSNALERKLLIYIIIVGVCILTLLVIWMIYSCSREDQQQQVKVIDASKYHGDDRHRLESDKRREQDGGWQSKSSKKRTSAREKSLEEHSRDTANNNDALTHVKQPMDSTSVRPQTIGHSAIGNNLLKSSAAANRTRLSAHQDKNLMTPTDTATIASKRDHLSMYNGQVWFEPAGGGKFRNYHYSTGFNGDRRASSAPSGNSLDSALVATIGGAPGGRTSAQPMSQGAGVPRSAVGQFFPNTVGYIENLASLGIGGQLQQRQQHPVYIDSRLLAATTGQSRRNRRRKVAPAPLATNQNQLATGGKTLARHPKGQDHRAGHVNGAFEPDLETGASDDHHHDGRHRHRHHRRLQDDGASLSSTRSCSSESPIENESVFLDSDQELLGFDSTGTPIIATHTRRRSSIAPNNQLVASGSKSLFLDGLSLGRASSGAPSGQTTILRERLPVEPVGSTKASGGTEEASSAGGQARRDEDLAGATVSKRIHSEESVDRDGEQDGQPVDVLQLDDEKSGATGEQTANHTVAEPVDSTEPVEPLGSKPDNTQPVATTSKAESEIRELDGAQKLIGMQQAGDGETRRPSDEASAVATSARARRPKIGQTRVIMPSEDRQSASSGMSLPSIEGIDRRTSQLRDMKNSELLEKQSIFAITYNQLATDHLPG